jgi:hypothetical protein
MDGGAPNAPPFGASPARQPSYSRKDQFPEFWEAIGRRATVAESEQAIREFLSGGIEYDKIVAGGRRWAAYNVATGGRRRATPLQWLQKEKWRDDWTLSAVRNGTPRAVETGAKPSRGAVKKPSAKKRKGNPKKSHNTVDEQKTTTTSHKSYAHEYRGFGNQKSNLNPQYVTWHQEFTKIKQRAKQKRNEFDNHREACSACIIAKEEDQLCEKGFLIFIESNSLQEEIFVWRKLNLPPKI